MPHFRCVTCRIRVYNAGGPADLIDDLCPGCGVALEPVSALAGLVGFRAITAGDRSAEAGASSTYERTVDCVCDLLGRRALQGQARLDAERWGDEGRGTTTEAVALPRPETTC